MRSRWWPPKLRNSTARPVGPRNEAKPLSRPEWPYGRGVGGGAASPRIPPESRTRRACRADWGNWNMSVVEGGSWGTKEPTERRTCSSMYSQICRSPNDCRGTRQEWGGDRSGCTRTFWSQRFTDLREPQFRSSSCILIGDLPELIWRIWAYLGTDYWPEGRLM